ncbi:MAG: DNA-3-methyladenine glycosylase, partial [Bacteroidota bacterium]
EEQRILLSIDSPKLDHLRLTCLNHKLTTQEIRFCKKYVIDWFDLDRDLSAFYQMAQQDAILSGLISRFHGLRLIGIPDLFEALSWAIIGQQINLNFAYTLKKRLVENYGTELSIDGTVYFLFPNPGVVANLNVTDLRPLQFSQRKAEYLIDLAGQMHRGELNKVGLQALSFEAAKKRLIQIRGIGNWTANYVLMKSLRHPDAFPIEDAGLHNALKRQLGLERKPTLAEIQTMAKGWEGWQAYATFYLWQSLLN